MKKIALIFLLFTTFVSYGQIRLTSGNTDRQKIDSLLIRNDSLIFKLENSPKQRVSLSSLGDTGETILLNTAFFDKNLSTSDTNVQLALETLDELIATGGGTGADVQQLTEAEYNALPQVQKDTLDADIIAPVGNAIDADLSDFTNDSTFVKGTKATRTNVIDLPRMYAQLQADYNTDGAAPSNEIVIIPDAILPAEEVIVEDVAGNFTGTEVEAVLAELAQIGGTDDQVATEVPFTPDGSIAATNVQAAIQEVRDEANPIGFGQGLNATTKSTGLNEVYDNSDVTETGGSTDRRAWNKHTTNDTILLSDAITLYDQNWKETLWGADSLYIRKGQNTTIYLSDSTTAIGNSGVVLKGGRKSASIISSAANEFYIDCEGCISHNGAAYAPPAAIPVVESYTQSFITSAASDISVNKPSGVVAGDLLVILTGGGLTTSSNQFAQGDAPTGFTFIEADGSSDGGHVGAFWKIADGGEGASFTVGGFLGSNMQRWASCLRISGADANYPVGLTSEDAGAASPAVVPSITTNADNSLILYAVTGYGSDTGPFGISGTGWSETDEIDNTNEAATGADGVWGQRNLAAAGASGDATVSMTTSDGWAGIQLEIRSNSSLGSELVTNGTFATDTDWTKLTGTTISGGVATVKALGNIGSGTINWALQQLDMVVDWAPKVYLVTFDARATVGTGRLQVSNRYNFIADFVPTGSFVTYSFIHTTHVDSDHDLVFGGYTVDDEFEIDNVSIKEILPE